MQLVRTTVADIAGYLSHILELIPSALDTLAQLNPNLTSLRLDFCGRMNDAVMDAWSTSLPALTHVELLGPFLVRPPGWLKFFSSHPKLEAFLITQSPRFDLACLKSLLANCKALSALRLKEVGLLNDQFLTALGTIKKGRLTSLDLSEPSQSCTEAAMIKAMKAIGGNLTKLDLSGHSLLGDAFLEKGLKPLRHLEDLALNNLPELTDAGVAKLFDGWENAALTRIDLSRNYGLGSNALTGILEHSGDALQRLNLNGWGDFDTDAIHAFGKELVVLDLGWCRSVDDFFIKDILECCGKLREVKVWGCNRVTDRCPRKVGSPCAWVMLVDYIYLLARSCHSRRGVARYYHLRHLGLLIFYHRALPTVFGSLSMTYGSTVQCIYKSCSSSNVTRSNNYMFLKAFVFAAANHLIACH